MAFDLTIAIGVLDRTPRVLAALLSDLPPALMTANEGGDSWRPFDVLGHLIDGDETDWMTRVRVILRPGPNRRFAPFDRFRHISRNQGRAAADLLAEFERLRTENLSELRTLNLSPADLQLTGEHPAFGTVTLEQLLATWVAHDLGHLAQIARVMAKQYRDAVGPWEAYLPVLHR